MKIAAVLSHPNQHLGPAFQALAKQNGIEFRVFYCCNMGMDQTPDVDFGVVTQWDVPLLQGHDSEFLRKENPPKNFSFFEMDAPILDTRLDAFRPEFVWVFGHGSRLNWRALAWARRHGAKVLSLGDSELLHHRNFAQKLTKQIVVRTFLSQTHRVITIGDNNEIYYRHYGLSADRMVRGCIPIDMERYLLDDSVYFARRAEIRARLRIPSDYTVFCFSGKFIHRKRPLDFIQACVRARKEYPSLHAILLGDGPLRGQIEQAIALSGASPAFSVVGFVNQSEMPSYLAASDVLVMTSEMDPHPLAVTEAMACRATALLSDRIGCIGETDVLRPGKTGEVFPCGDTAMLARKIGALMEEPQTLQRLRTQATEVAKTQSPDLLKQAVLIACASLTTGYIGHSNELPR